MTEPELTWERTWQSRSDDLSAFDGNLLVGRVYRILGGVERGHWHWGVHATVGDHVLNAAGVADERNAACRLVEEAYSRLRQRMGERDR